jgi:hypothetical protein
MKIYGQLMRVTVIGTMLSIAPVAALAQSSTQSTQDSPKQEMKDAGHDTKQAAKNTGSAVKGTTKSTGHAVKKGTNKAASKTAEGAQKVENKTSSQ